MRGANARRLPCPPPPGAVFQYIGTLDRPAQIGLVKAGGLRTVFDFDTGDVRFTASGRAIAYRTLPAGSAARARADHLIHRWEAERWRRAGEARS